MTMKTALPLLAAALALAPAASAQAPTGPTGPTGPTPPPTTPPPPPPPPPPPAPAGAKIAARFDSGLSERGHLYVINGEKLVVRGRLKPFVPGQKVIVSLYRRGKLVGRKVAKVHKGKGAGEFVVTLRARRPGSYGVRVRHKATAKQAAAASRRLAVTSIVPSAHSGSSGTNVRLLQLGLARLAYVNSRSGYFDDSTGRALIAYRKVNHMARIASATPAIFKRLFAGQGGFRLRYPRAGKHVEFDWSRQVLVLASGGAPERIYHASSGKPSTPTVFGTFSFYRKSFGTNAKGMVDSNYFVGGYAIHGYHDVPTYAASHGCIRVPIPNASSIYNWVSLGDRIFVYR
jgi:lipoprotein-anchoring transpeptidase ErfK/SrfK